jgi:hypothetical protein
MQKYTITDVATGEEITVKYLAGSPKQYRFNGQTGQFNLNGDTPLLDDKNKPVSSISITPLAFRFFEENLFGRGKKENWAEIFFIDSKNALSSIMFNNSSVGRLESLAQELFYEDLSLTQISLTITPEKKENDKGKYFIISLGWAMVEPEQVIENQKFVESVPVWRRDTFTETAVTHLFSGYHFPKSNALPEAETVAE